MKKTLLLMLALAVAMLIFSPAEAAKKKVAVLDFEFGTIRDRWWPGDWDLGKGISDMMVTQLVKDGTYSVIERRQLDKVLSEQKLGASGLVDTSTAAKIGKILGVQAVIVGSITQFSIDTQNIELGGITRALGFGGAGISTTTAKVYIDARMIDTTTAEIIGVAEGKAEKDKKGLKLAGGNYRGFGGIAFGGKGFSETLLGEATRDAVVDVAKQLSGKSGGVGEGTSAAPAGPAKGKVADVDVPRGSIIVDAGSGQGVAVGQTLYVLRIKKEIKSPQTGEVIKRLVDVVAELKVTEVDSVSATATVVKGKASDIRVGDDVSSSQSL